MSVRFLLVLLLSPSWGQREDLNDLDLLNFYENSVEKYERPLDIANRNLVDYDTRESPPFQTICEVHFELIQFRERDPAYEYHHYPKFNASCIPSEVTDALNYSRFHPHKDFCIVKHQRFADEDHLCKTVYRTIPVLKRKRGSSCWSYEYQKYGVGCKCHIAVKYD